MLNFYELLLDSQNWKTEDILLIIDKLINKENYKDLSLDKCNIITENIYKKLNDYNINSKIININNIYKELSSHEFIISIYKDERECVNYLLIDPTYSFFCKKDNKKSPLYFDAWPGEILQNINPILLNNLFTYGYTYIDDKNIRDYFRSFTNKNVNINLETIILSKYSKEKVR